MHSPKIEQLEVVARGDVRRAKLYYLRGRVGKRARVAERRWGIEDDLVLAPEAEDPPRSTPRASAQEEAEPVRAGEEGERGAARSRLPRQVRGAPPETRTTGEPEAASRAASEGSEEDKA